MKHRHPGALAVIAALVVAASFYGVSVATPAQAATVTLREVAGSPLTFRYQGGDVSFETLSTFSSAAVGDVTGDAQPEVIVGGMNSPVRVIDMAAGRTTTLDPGISNDITGAGIVQASPALGDMDGDGVDDVVVANMGAQIAAYSMRGGNPRALYNRSVPPAFSGISASLFPTPALGYVDIDRSLDVVTTSWGMVLDAWSGPTGEPIAPLHQWLKDSIWSSPVIGDVDGDGRDEIVVGADCEGLSTLQPCYGLGQGGYVWAFNMDGSVQWSYFVRDAVVWSTPALIDLNGDAALDVVVGTGLFFDRPAADKIMAIDGRTGGLLWNAPTPERVLGSPAVGLVNGQPRVWVVSGGGYLMSWDARGNLLWQQCITDGQPCGPHVGTWGGVSVADVNNDGTLDAVVQAEESIRVFDATTGALEAVARSTYGHAILPSSATPTIADVNGQTWIVQMNIGDANGNGRADGRDDLLVTIWSTGQPLGAAPWPTFKGNMARNGGTTQRAPASVAPGGSACMRLTGSAGDAAIVNLTPVEALGPGFGLLIASGITPPVASNVNYQVGTIDPNVAVAPLGSDGRVCYANSATSWVHAIADHLGTIRAGAYTPARPGGAPERKVDTRIGLGGGMLAPSGRLCFGVAGAPGDGAVVNLTPVDATAPGFGLLVSSGIEPPVASNANFRPNSFDPNVAIAPIGSDGQVCFINSEHAFVHLVADHLGTIRASAYVPAAASGAPERKVDTRVGLGGAKIPPSGQLCFAVPGSPGDAAVVNLTPVEAAGPGFGLLTSSGISAPVASNTNYGPGTVDPNVAFAPIGADGKVCFHNSAFAAVHLVADHLGTIGAASYVPAQAGGAPVRKIDTRIFLV